MSKPDDSDIHKEADEIDNEDEEEDCIETTIERVQHDQEELMMEERDQEEQEEENESSENGIDEEVKEGNKKKDYWFEKVKPFMDHFREVSITMVLILGTLLSFDEMMVQFMGRSYETHQIKGKPIGEGFKLFVLTTF